MTARPPTHPDQRAARPAWWRGALAGALVCLGAGACARYSRNSLMSGSQDAPLEGAAADRPVVSVSGPPFNLRAVPVEVVHDPLTGSGGTLQGIEAEAGDPPTGAGTPPAQGPTELVDAKVGEVNGKPIYAGRFFEEGPGERLRQKAREKGITHQAWIEFAWEQIDLSTRLLQQDELFEAEARASLKPPQRQGLRSFVQEIGEKERRSAGGSRTALERSLQESRNMTYEQFLRNKESQVLIDVLIAQKVEPRVFVTFRDIERYYERNIKEFCPDPTARFRLIRVPTARADDVRAVQEALDGGTPFEEVARWPSNTANPDEGGLRERTFTGPRDKADLFGEVRELNDAARTLAAGDWTRAPLIYGLWTSWLCLESIVETRRLLTDEEVQLDITNRLTAKKRQEVANSFLRRLAFRAPMEELGPMQLRLLQIADLRYWQTRAEAN